MTDDPILSHCEMLHDLARGIDGVLVVSTFYASATGDTDRPGVVTHHQVGDAERMADAIRDQLGTPGANVYAGLQVMRRGLARGARGSASDVVAVLGLVADMDSDTGRAGGDLPFPPSYVVETSPGNAQPVWLFDRPLSLAEAKPIAAALRKATGSDAGTADPVHIWRVPGTLNWPNKAKIARGRSPEPCDVKVLQPWDGSLVSVDAFAAALPAVTATESSPAQVGAIPATVDASADLLAMLAADGQPDRSSHAARVIEAIAFAGHSLEEAVALVLAAPAGSWADRYPNAARAQRDVERMWSKFGGSRAEDVARGRQAADSLLASATPASPPPEKTAHLIKPTAFKWRDPASLPRLEFMLGSHLIRGFPSSTLAPGGIGKSSLSIAEAIALGSGRPLFGGGFEPKRRVWLFNGEDDRDLLEMRIIGTCLHHKVDPLDIEGYLFVDTGREAPIVIAEEDRNGTRIIKPVVDAVMAGIREHKIDVLIIDPFVSTHGVPENDNGAIDKVAKQWGKIAGDCGVAIDIVHHVRKVDGREVSVEDGRGAVALLNAVRSARVLNRMSSEQAKHAGLTEDERLQYFSVTEGKTNLSVGSSRAVWRRLVSVPLNNHGTELTDPGGHIGAVEAWEWPAAEDALEAVTPDDLSRLKAQIGARELRQNAQANDWVGKVVAEVLGLDVDDDKQKIKAMVAAWIKSGDLAILKRKDRTGQARPFVVAGDP